MSNPIPPPDARRRRGDHTSNALADMLGHNGTDTTCVHARIVDKMTENPAKYPEGFLVG